ncbi:sodium-coupled monocarboxylate transporter 2-like [Danaus plexippus]|uniref:Sodium-coupled monocarboxylate transporter 1 n=1 Tax=Danaus plexippus plexippus TaxID=278856 RepID=A0A212F725_DANPL|nr:sodium-coupled monocarboxylate transporter 2-like [Danaus plexippus]OWR49524.1 Sodium-coupled monocarboxylate transporter 1 [Danaus plexippus plexippus]
MRNSSVPVLPIYFNVAEYCLFGIIVGVIIGIIVYYVFVNNKYNTVSGFLFGGKNMSIISISLALTASHLTSITLLGVPVEIYLRGTQYWASALSLIFVTFLTAVIYLPVFHRLQLSSSFEYLEIRFSTHIRTIAAVLFVVSKLMLLPIVPYVPLLAFRLVTNAEASRITAALCVACSTFIAVGGLRAIVSIGIVTTFLAFAGTALPSGLALLPMGFKKMWEVANHGSRLVLYDPDPEIAHHTSFFVVTLALSTNWLWKIALSQSSLQKLLAVPTISKARICLTISCVGVILMKLLSCFLGLVLYAWFAGCDPLLTGQIKKHEQLVPHFLNNLSTMFPGICGIFIISIFSATACCIASIINSVSGVVFEEFIRPWMPESTNELACCRFMKFLCIVVGLYCGAVIWLVLELDRLQHVASGVTGVTAGTLLGIFTLGIVFSRANCSGALSGCLLSLLLCGWLLVGAENALATGALTFQGKPLVTSGCGKTNFTHILNVTTIIPVALMPKKPLQSLFRISFTYCPFAGAITVLLIGVPMSYLTGKSKTDSMNPDVFCPLTQSFLHRLPDRSNSVSLELRPANTQEVYMALDEALKHLKEVIDKK